MKVLHYNWVDPEDHAGRGGGVRLYMQALVAAQRQAGWQVSTLASGLAHDLGARPPYWRACREGHYEIVNSACLAPSHADFATLAQVQDAATEAVFFDFMERTGPYDVVHIQSLEGVPAQVLALKDRFAHTRLVLSLHNYHPFCPQVNLWWRERVHCADFASGTNCATCLPVRARPGSVRLGYAVETVLSRLSMGPGTGLHTWLFEPLMRAGWRGVRSLGALRKPARVPSLPSGGHGAPYAARRARIVALINAHCDTVLAVSERTKTLAEGFGVTGAVTSHIGTDHAAFWRCSAPRDLPRDVSPKRPLRLAYLGYMRHDKGFGFLLDALETLPPETAACLHLTVAARRGDGAMMAQMESLHARLAGLDWHDGYRREGLDALLAGIHCGIVPPLWEDNLPQVALEMHARHIPILTSDRGGAQELAGTRELSFRAGCRDDLHALLARIINGEVVLDTYWARARVPVSMAEHARELATYYGATDEGADTYRDTEIGNIVDSGVSWAQPHGAGRTGCALRSVQP